MSSPKHASAAAAVHVARSSHACGFALVGRTHAQVTIAIPESQLFNRLLYAERKLQDQINHRKADVREAVVMPEHVKKKLRLYVYAAHAHQPRPASAAGTGAAEPSTSAGPTEPPSWVLHITGRLIDPPGAPSAPPLDLRALAAAVAGGAANAASTTAASASGAAQASTSAAQQKTSLTQVLRRLEVRLECKDGTKEKPLLWEKASHQVGGAQGGGGHCLRVCSGCIYSLGSGGAPLSSAHAPGRGCCLLWGA